MRTCDTLAQTCDIVLETEYILYKLLIRPLLGIVIRTLCNKVYQLQKVTNVLEQLHSSSSSNGRWAMFVWENNTVN